MGWFYIRYLYYCFCSWLACWTVFDCCAFHNINNNNNNKFAQSNLGRRPRCGTVAHVRRKVPIGYNGTPQKVPLSVDRSPYSATCLIPGPVRPMMPKDIRIRSAVLATMHWTDRPTDTCTYVGTDRSSTGEFDDYRPLRYESDAI